MKYANKYVHNPEDIPSGEHWAIITATSVYIPGDERSRTAPGHGYPERTESYIEYAAYTNEAEFRDELSRQISSNRVYGKSVRGIHVLGTYSSKTEVVLEEIHRTVQP